MVDGVFNDACWEKYACLVFSNFVKPDFSRIARVQTTAKACYDEGHLYFAVRCQEPRVAGMRAEVKQRDGRVWQDDCIEFFFDPGRTREMYYQIVANSSGVVFDQKKPGSVAWDSGVKLETRMLDTGWVLEASIPWAAFEEQPSAGEVWGFNLGRERYAAGARELSLWSATGGKFGRPQRFGELVFEGAPVCYEITVPALFGFGPNHVSMSPVSDVAPTVRILRELRGCDNGRRGNGRPRVVKKSNGWHVVVPVVDGTEIGTVVAHGDRAAAGFVQALPFGITPKPLTARIAQRMSTLRKRWENGGPFYARETASLLERAQAMLDRFIQSNESRSTPMPREEWKNAYAVQRRMHDHLAGLSYLVWTKSPLKNLLPTQVPLSMEKSPQVLIKACVNEREAASFVISNLGEKAFTGRLNLDTLRMIGPEADAVKSAVVFSDCLSVHDVLFQKLRNGQTVADPLPCMNEAQSFIIPAGQSREFWLELDTAYLAPGRYKGSIKVTPFDHDIPPKTAGLEVEIKPVRLPDRMPIAIYNWDYASDERYVHNLVGHRTNCFRMNTDLPIKIAKDGRRKTPTDWRVYDRMLRIKLRYAREQGGILVFSYGLIRDFHRRYSRKYGWEFMNEQWKRAFRAWVLEFERHLLEDIGVTHEEYVIQLWDEARHRNAEMTITAARFLRSIAPRMRTCMDGAQDRAEIRAMEPVVDHWIPHQGALYHQGKPSARHHIYRDIMKQGKPVWSYTCETNMKALNPLDYYRLKEWRAWDLGVQGSCYWAYNSWRGDPWNDFDGPREDCGVVYNGPDGPVNSRRWEATRDGREDYLCLHMLQKAGEAKDAENGRQVKAFIEKLVAQVLDSPSDVEGFEKARSQLLKRLESVCAPSIPELIDEPDFSIQGNEIVCRLRASRPVTVQFLVRKPGYTKWHSFTSEHSAEPTLRLSLPFEGAMEWFLIFHDKFGATGSFLKGIDPNKWIRQP